MSDYIKREDVIELVLEPLSNMPSEDVVEVVRCKDCIYHSEHSWCGADHLGGRWTEGDDFCSFGERKDK